MMQNKRGSLLFALMMVFLGASMINIGGSLASYNVVVDCGKFFTNNEAGILNLANPGTGANSSIAVSLLTLGILVSLMMLSVIGIVYAFGYAFGIEKLKVFVKSEILESVMNLIVVTIIIGGGIGVFQPAMVFISNLALLGTGGQSAAPQNTVSIFTNLCNNVQNNIIISSIQNWLGVFVGLFINDILQHFQVSIAPNGFGIGITPFYGYSALIETYWLEQTTFLGGMEFGIFVITTLFAIYYLFPIFLYTGLVLRAFPWTRAAGGAFLAMFIGFYVVFPALLYPFTLYGPHQDSYLCAPHSLTGQNNAGVCNAKAYLSAKTFAGIAAPFTQTIGETLYEDVADFINGLAYIGLQLFGLIIAVIISYDMVEYIADIIGAPSMEGRKVLSRVL